MCYSRVDVSAPVIMTRDVPHLSLSEEAYVGKSESGKNGVSGRTATSMRKDTKIPYSIAARCCRGRIGSTLIWPTVGEAHPWHSTATEPEIPPEWLALMGNSNGKRISRRSDSPIHNQLSHCRFPFDLVFVARMRS